MNRRSYGTYVLLLGVSLSAVQAQAQLSEPTVQEPVHVQNEQVQLDDKSAASGSVPVNKAIDDGETLNELMGRPGGLTSSEAARQAAEYSRDAIIAQEDYKYAKAKKTETIYNYLPRLTVTASYTRQSVPGFYKDRSAGSLVGTTSPAGPLTPADPLYAIDGSSFNFSPLANNWYLNAGLIVPISDYLLNFSQAISGVNAATRSARLNEKAARLNAAANARLSYYEWVRARLRVREAEKALKRAQVQLLFLQRMSSGGRVARADVMQQEAFTSNAELNVRRASTTEAIARENLFVLMSGADGASPRWEIGEDILAPQPFDDAPLGEIDALQKEAIQQRLEIQALEQTMYAIRDRSSVERSRGYPRVEGFGNLTYSNPNSLYIPPQNEWNGTWDVGVRAVWTLNDLGANYAQSRASDTEAAKVREQRQQLIDNLHAEVLGAYRTVEEARLARHSAKQGVDAAAAAHVDRRQLFENGRGTSLDVLQAETALITSRLNLIDSHIALKQAQTRLDHAVGRDIADAGAD